MTSSDAPAATPDASPAAPAAPADDVAAPSEPSSTAASSAGGEQEERQLHPTKEAYLPVVKEDINKGALGLGLLLRSSPPRQS